MADRFIQKTFFFQRHIFFLKAISVKSSFNAMYVKRQRDWSQKNKMVLVILLIIIYESVLFFWTGWIDVYWCNKLEWDKNILFYFNVLHQCTPVQWKKTDFVSTKRNAAGNLVLWGFCVLTCDCFCFMTLGEKKFRWKNSCNIRWIIY